MLTDEGNKDAVLTYIKLNGKNFAVIFFDLLIIICNFDLFFHRIRFLRFTFSAVIVRCPHFDFLKKQVQFFH